MNKLFNFAQAKGKWHKFPSFDLGGGAKLYKNFAQKLLAVSLCMAVVLLGTPVTTFAAAPEPLPYTLEYENSLTKTKITGVTADNFDAVTSIEIPATVTDIAADAFDQCSNLEAFTVAGGTAFSVDAATGALYSYSATDEWATLYRLPPAFAGEYKRPDTVTEIKDGAFTNCSQLTTFNLGSGTEGLSWWDFTFAGCSSLSAFAGQDPSPEDRRHLGVDRDGYLQRGSGGTITSYTLLRVPPASVKVFRYEVDSYSYFIDSDALVGCRLLPGSLLTLGDDQQTIDPSLNVSGMDGAPLLVPASVVDGSGGDDITISPDNPASVLGYKVDEDDDTKLYITSRTGNTEKELNLACNTFVGYTLAVEDAEEIPKLTIRHTYGEDHKCATCGADEPVVPVTGVTLSDTTKSLKVDETFELTATVTPEGATDPTVTWESSAPTVATVDEAGVVTAVAPGTAIITVTTDNGTFTATCTVTVTQPVTGVTLSDTTKSLKVDETFELTATVTPENATDPTVTWDSSAPTVATVDEAGVVTAVAPGTATITATASDGSGVSDSCAVTVTQPDGGGDPDDPGDLPSVDRSSWGTPYVREADGVTQYVVEDPTSPDFGMTSVELVDAWASAGGGSSAAIFWVHESSGGSSAWYGVAAASVSHLSDLGYRFYVQWLSPGDPGYDVLFDRLNDEDKQRVEDDNGWLFNMGVRAPDGTDVHYLVTDEVVKQPIVYVQIGDDWDVDDLNAYYLAVGGNEKVPVDYLMIDYPEGTDTFGRMTLDHFSPYFIFDELNAEELAALKNNQNQTGDLATQLLISGLSIVLVSSLGVMLRLITNKRKFEE